MNIGEVIYELRKKNNLTQEQLGEKLGVSRQTISKWELGETFPDLKDSLNISQLFNISLDDFLNNNLENRIKKNEVKTKKIFKIIFIILAIILFTEIGLFIGYLSGKGDKEVVGRSHLECTLDNEQYGFYVDYDETNDIIYMDGSEYIFKNIVRKKEYTNSNNLINDIYNYFKDKNGLCE